MVQACGIVSVNFCGIVTLYEGEITGSFRAGEIVKEEIGLYMTGSKRQGGAEA